MMFSNGSVFWGDQSIENFEPTCHHSFGLTVFGYQFFFGSPASTNLDTGLAAGFRFHKPRPQSGSVIHGNQPTPSPARYKGWIVWYFLITMGLSLKSSLTVYGLIVYPYSWRGRGFGSRLFEWPTPVLSMHLYWMNFSCMDKKLLAWCFSVYFISHRY